MAALQFFLSPVDGYLGCLYFEAIINNTFMIIHVQILCRYVFVVYVYIMSGIAGSYDNSVFNLLRNFQNSFPKELYKYCTFPPTEYGGFDFFSKTA